MHKTLYKPVLYKISQFEYSFIIQIHLILIYIYYIMYRRSI